MKKKKDKKNRQLNFERGVFLFKWRWRWSHKCSDVANIMLTHWDVMNYVNYSATTESE